MQHDESGAFVLSIRVVDVEEEHWRYVSLCTHVDEENPDNLRAAELRLKWLRASDVKTKVAIDGDGKPLGFIHVVPIEAPLSGMVGRNFMVIPCLTLGYQLVYGRRHGTGIGRGLIQAVEEEAKERGFKGLAVYAYGGDFWFMPSAFFQRLGFKQVGGSNIWVKKWGEAEDPTSSRAHYEYKPIPGKAVVDYFWAPFCFTVCKEVLNIRQVVSEFGDRVELREYRADDPEIAARHGLFRALFINGEHKDWGHEALKEDLRKEIRKSLQGSPSS